MVFFIGVKILLFFFSLQVPALEHNGKVIGESLDLIKYVDSNFEGPSLFPEVSHKIYLFGSLFGRVFLEKGLFVKTICRLAFSIYNLTILVHTRSTLDHANKEF